VSLELQNNKLYDYLIVGAGFYGAICAHELVKRGKSVLVIEKRDHIGGNCYTRNVEGVHVHEYGPHIFHTNDKKIWEWINQFAEFNNYKNTPVANYKGEIYSLPFSMWTFAQMWGVKTPEEAKEKIESQRYDGKVTNLEEQALSLVGKDIYEKLIKGYTTKQWRKDPKELPASIIKRLPVRFTYDNNYFNDKYQGIPIGGYTQIFEKLFDGVNIKYNVDYFERREQWDAVAENLIYTGPIDKFFDYKHGDLEYKSIRWENELMDKDNHQGCAVMNYTDVEVPYTRVIEHKYFDDQNQKVTYVSKEFPQEYKRGVDPFYPVNDETNTAIYKKYKSMADDLPNVHFGGRLATYKYYDMHQVIAAALHDLETKIK
jgi:UDP-galactopyranose mutase